MAKTTLSDTLFPVKEYPANFAYNSEAGISDVKENTGYKFIVREDTNEVLSCMTDEYRMVKNVDVLNSALNVLKDTSMKSQLSETRIFGNGARTQWKWIIKGVKVKIAKDDYVNPEILIRNSYDGSCQVHILTGAYRILCSNGLVIGTTISQKSSRHSIHNVHLDNIEDYIRDSVNTAEKVFVEDFSALVENKIKGDKDIQALIKLFPTTVMDSLVQYFMAHPPKTYWDLLNSATSIATHNMHRQNEATHKLENQIYPLISKMAKA